jgi:threonine aldolase
MDGARVFNAAEYLGAPVRELVAEVDTVSFCLSKALGAPVGSLIAGTGEQMRRGRLLRKRLGGGMRQAGVLAAAGLIALEQGPSNLAADHANAAFLACELAKIPGITVDPGRVQTNIVIFGVQRIGIPAPEFSARLKAKGVLMNAVGPAHVRLVTHYDVNREGAEQAARAIAEVARG